MGVGWDLTLGGLERHLASGAPNDHEAAERWASSPEGKAFVRASSARWGQAAIAAGAAPEMAEAAAARTAGFYTGEPPASPTGSRS